jgi:hypothetical protein
VIYFESTLQYIQYDITLYKVLSALIFNAFDVFVFVCVSIYVIRSITLVEWLYKTCDETCHRCQTCDETCFIMGYTIKSRRLVKEYMGDAPLIINGKYRYAYRYAP